MPFTIPLPPSTAMFVTRDGVLEVTDKAAALRFDLRVDGGVVYGRFPDEPDAAQWTEASLVSIMALFAAESPAALFLRRSGIQPLRQLLTDLAVGSIADEPDAP